MHRYIRKSLNILLTVCITFSFLLFFQTGQSTRLRRTISQYEEYKNSSGLFVPNYHRKVEIDRSDTETFRVFWKDFSSKLHLVQIDLNVTSRLQSKLIYSFGVFEVEQHILDADYFPKPLGSKPWVKYSSQQNDPRLLHKEKSQSRFRPVKTHHFLCNDEVIIHLAVMHMRGQSYWVGNNHGNYYWMGKLPESGVPDECKMPEGTLSLRYPMAIDDYFMYNLKNNTRMIDGAVIYEPQYMDIYMWHIPRSRFMECEYEDHVWFFRKTYSSVITHGDNIDVHELLSLVRRFVFENKVPLMLYAGSLLGWYRQCDHIVHSVDVDFALPAQYLTEEVFKNFYLHSGIRVYQRYGTPGHSLELVNYSSKNIKMDIFTIEQNEHKNISYAYLFAHQKRYRHYYPNINFEDLCTIEMVGVPVYAPCDPFAFINVEYGWGWFEPNSGRNAYNQEYLNPYSDEEYKMIRYNYSYTKCANPTIMWGCDPPIQLTPVTKPAPVTAKPIPNVPAAQASVAQRGQPSLIPNQMPQDAAPQRPITVAAVKAPGAV